MANLGRLDLVLTGDSSQLQNELKKINRESNAAGAAIADLFSNDTFNSAALILSRGVVISLIDDVNNLGGEFNLADTLAKGLSVSIAEFSPVALIRAGQAARFLGDQLEEYQSVSLEEFGLGQIGGIYEIVTAGERIAAVVLPALSAVSGGFQFLDDVLAGVQANINSVSGFFKGIAGNAQLASNVLQAAVELIDHSIDILLETLAQISPEFAFIRNQAKDLGIEFKIGQSIFGEYIAELNKIDSTATAVAAGLDRTSGAAGELRGNVAKASGVVDGFTRDLAKQAQAAAHASKGIRDLGDAATLLNAYKVASEIQDQFLGGLVQNFNAAKAAQSLNAQLTVTSKSAGGAAQDLAFLDKTTDRLGVNLQAATQGYVKFSAAATQTELSSERIQRIFEQITQSTAVMRLSVADTEGVFLALQQIVSGGNLQLEELNQIAERIPGTFQAAAKALGVADSQLKELVSTGKVDSVDFIEKFAAQLAAQTQSGVVGASAGAEAAVNRFNNSLLKLQTAMGETWVEIGVPALNLFADALKFAADNEELLSTAIDSLLVAAAGRGLIAVFEFGQALRKGGLAAQLFTQQIKATALQVGSLALQAGLAYAATVLIYRNLDRVKDGAQSTRTAITSLDNALIELETSLQASTKGAGSLAGIIPENPPPTDWIDGAVAGLRDLREEGGLAGKALETAINVTPAGIGLVLNKAVNYFKTGKFEIVTNAEKQLNDLLVAVGDFSGKADALLGESINLREQTKIGQGPINDLKAIDAQLKQIEQRKIGLDPKDEQAVAAILAEENELLKQRAEAQKQIAATQNGINVALAQAKQQLQEVTAQAPSAGQQQAKTILEARIKGLESEKQKLDEVANTAVNTAQKTTESFETRNKALTNSFQTTQAEIAEALASGAIDEEEFNRRSLEAEKGYLAEKLKLNQSTLDKLKADLDKNAKLKAINPTDAFLTPEQEKQYKQQVEQLELETSKTRIDLATRTREDKQKILEEELQDLESANKAAEAAIAQSQNSRILAVRQQQLAGKVSAEAAEEEIQKIQQDSLQKQIDELKNQKTKVDELESAGKLNAEEAASRRQELDKEIGSTAIQQVEAELQARKDAEEAALQARKDAEEKALKAIEDAAKKAQFASAQSQNERIAAVKRAQLDGVKGEEAAAQEIEAIQTEGTKNTIALKQNELAELRAARQRGTVNVEAAAEKEFALIQEIGQLSLSLLDAELKAQQELKQARIDGLREQLEAERSAAEVRRGLLDIEKQGLSETNNLLSARSGLLDAQTNLIQQRLQFALDDAEASGNSVAAERLRNRIIAEQIAAQNQQNAIAQQQLQLKQEQNALDRESQRINAEIAIQEAEIAIAEARLNGESKEKIAGLERIADLRREQLEALDRQGDAQERINRLEQDALNLTQQANSERLRRQQLLEGADATKSASETKVAIGNLGATAPGFGRSPLADLQQSSSTINPASLSANNGNLIRLSQYQPIAPAPRTLADQSQQIVQRLDQLIGVTREGTSRPNLTISNQDDLSMAGKVYSDISRSRARAANL